MEVASQPRLGWRGGLSEVIAQIQRMEFSGRGHAQGELEPKPSGERFSERSVTLRVDLPLGRSHFWEDEAGGRTTLQPQSAEEESAPLRVSTRAGDPPTPAAGNLARPASGMR